jgi:hypothetical protein
MQISKLATQPELILRAMTSLAQLTLSEMDLECESPQSHVSFEPVLSIGLLKDMKRKDKAEQIVLPTQRSHHG